MLEIVIKLILHEGVDAGLSGKKTSCPYKLESPGYDIWQRGFADGIEGSLAINVIGIIASIKKCLR